MSKHGQIRVGIGGWNYEPWHETFYPKGTSQSGELEYASRKVTAIEVNGTFYRLQKPDTYAKWRDATPEDFVFSLKAPRFIVQRKELAGAGTSIERFIGSGIAELKSKLGPILWQFAPFRRFDAADVEAFFALLPPEVQGQPLRHAIEVRHKSFLDPTFLALCRAKGAVIVYADDATYPACADLTGDFVYARLRQCQAGLDTGYPEEDLDLWVKRARAFSEGKLPEDLKALDPKVKTPAGARDVFLFFINGAKERAPAAAQALIKRLAER